MNQGERDELMVQFKLIQLRDLKITADILGIIESVGMFKEYGKLPTGLDLHKLNRMTDVELDREARKCGISKSAGRNKADSVINGVPFSLKSNQYAPPALVNHTTRPGFEMAASHSGGDIRQLDEIIAKYWELRIKRVISEDTRNSDPHSPFKGKKSVIKPFLNYFLFKGTGSSLSTFPAEKILAFTNPLDVTTWSIYDEPDAIDLFWDHLIFSMRAKKGMPAGYPNCSARLMACKPSIDKWTRHIDGDYRGALHIRAN